MNQQELVAAVRTVSHLAAYIDELKGQAGVLAKQIDPVGRGFFTPAEEEQCRALLISYWQSRNALLELITAFRDQTAPDKESYPEQFLVAFTAALILIDAARFLREVVDGRPVIRRKLNEPAVEFGIPGGTYDTVQKSLVSTRHAWHLFHAVRYFELNEADLRRRAARSGLDDVIRINDRLRERMNVTLSQFAHAKLRTRADQILRRMGRDVVVRAMYGLQRLGASMMADVFVRPGHRPQLPDEIAEQVRAILHPGDVLIVRKEHAVTNYFLPGYWPHAALYLGRTDDLQRMGVDGHQNVEPRWARLLESASTDEPRNVLESMKDGVLIRSLHSPFGADSIVVLRPQVTADHLAEALTRGLVHEGKPYDFDFNFARSDRLVCTEVVYRAYEGVGPIQFDLQYRAGRPTLSGSDLVQMGIVCHHFEPVAVYAPAFDAGVQTGRRAGELMRQAEGNEAAEPLGD